MAGYEIIGLKKKFGKKHPLQQSKKNKISLGNINQTNEISVWREIQVFQEKKWKKTSEDGEISHVHGLVE